MAVVLESVLQNTFQKLVQLAFCAKNLMTKCLNGAGGHAKTLMFAHVSPEADSFGETISTLKFAQRASTVELGAARMNKESTEVKALKEQVNKSLLKSV